MSKLKIRLLQIICFVVAFLQFGCEEDKRETPSVVSVYRIIKEDSGNYSYLVAAVERAGLKNLLDSETSNITLLAPTNQAFIDAGYANVNTIKISNPVVLEKILRYHIIENKIETKTIETLQVVTAIDGNELFFDKEVWSGKLNNKPIYLNNYYINGANILGKDFNANNGNVQLINKVLVPKTTNTIMQALTARADYSLFVAAITRASLGTNNYVSMLSSQNEFTVFAPTNAAMGAFLSGTYGTVAKINAADPAKVASELVGNHIISKAYFSYKLVGTYLSLNNGKLSVSANRYLNVANSIAGTNTVVNGGLLSRNTSNEMVSNGYINGVSSVFAVPTSLTLLESIQANTNLTFLAAAIDKASTSGVDIKGMLSSPGNLTIYAPINQAFRDAGYDNIDAVSNATADVLVQLLSKHIFNELIFSNSYPSGFYSVECIDGTIIEFNNTTTTNTYSAKGPFNSDYGVISSKDGLRTNGVFNIINQVIK